MFVLVVGGGKVGYYLTKELHRLGPRGRRSWRRTAGGRTRSPTRSARSSSPHDGCEGKYLAEAGCNRADIVAAVTGDDEDNLVICQMAKHHFDVPRTIARVNNPKNEELFRHLGVDEIISPTRMILGSIEQDIPVHELLHLAALARASWRSSRRTRRRARRPSAERRATSRSPTGCSLFTVIRDGGREARRLAGPARGRQGDRHRPHRCEIRSRAAHRRPRERRRLTVAGRFALLTPTREVTPGG